jgi:hypothetical protein
MDRNILSKMMDDLRAAVTAACPNQGVYIGVPTDVGTWGYHPAAGATTEQRAAATAVITNFPLSDYQDQGSIALLEDCYAARRSAYPPRGDQLDALMKGLDAVSATVTLPADTLAWIAACKAVKASNPKE